PMVKAVTWNVYGTLLAVSGGHFTREHPQKFIMDLALEKTIHEFKMWKSMSRKPGNPAEYMQVMINNVVDQLNFQVDKGETHPEIPHERIWEGILKKLMQNEYIIESGKYGTLEECAQKIAYFFHRSLQGVTAQMGAADTIHWLYENRYWQGLLADGQVFTPVHLERCFREQNPQVNLNQCIPPMNRVFSHACKSRKPSERLYREMISKLRGFSIKPEETLHISNDLDNDLAPARKYGFLTCLYTGDSKSLIASPKLVEDKSTRPNVMITELPQVLDMLQ
nr:HAD family hydrolase [Gemmatales bacterium]